MPQEIERRFILPSIDRALLTNPVMRIEQGYFETYSPNFLRVRMIDKSQFIITRKSGIGISRTEDEVRVDQTAGSFLLRSCPYSLEKIRHRLGDWEIDVYEPPLDGLVIAEIELDHPDQPVSIPGWMQQLAYQEVTGTLTNFHLARLASELRATGNQLSKPIAELLPKSIPLVVITGGPCSGKSTIMAILQQEMGTRAHFVPEIATIVISQVGVKFPQDDPIAAERFQEVIYRVQRSFEEASSIQARRSDKRAVVADRGVFDVAAYLPKGVDDLERICHTCADEEYQRYLAVICLDVPPREVYEAKRMNNPARSESYEGAVALGSKIEQVWSKHPNFVPVRETDWDAKVNHVRTILSNLLA